MYSLSIVPLEPPAPAARAELAFSTLFAVARLLHTEQPVTYRMMRNSSFHKAAAIYDAPYLPSSGRACNSGSSPRAWGNASGGRGPAASSIGIRLHKDNILQMSPQPFSLSQNILAMVVVEKRVEEDELQVLAVKTWTWPIWSHVGV